MKKLIFIFVLFGMLAAPAKSQELLPDSLTVTQNLFYLEMNASSAIFAKPDGWFGEDGVRSFEVRFGVRVLSRLSLFYTGGHSMVVPPSGSGIKRITGFDGGLGVDYRLVDYQKKTEDVWWLFRTVDVHAAWSTTMNSSDWDYLKYDVGFSFGLRKRYTPTIGISYRYYDSRTPGISDQKGVFVAAGIRL